MPCHLAVNSSITPLAPIVMLHTLTLLLKVVCAPHRVPGSCIDSKLVSDLDDLLHDGRRPPYLYNKTAMEMKAVTKPLKSAKSVEQLKTNAVTVTKILRSSVASEAQKS